MPHPRLSHDHARGSITFSRNLNLAITLFPLFSVVAAGPLGHHVINEGQLHRRQASSAGGLQPSVYVPIAVVISIVAVIVLVSWWNKEKLRALTAQRPQPPVTRELTAEQLAGTINGTTVTGVPIRTRRGRRPRRTPSQMSVTSLPEYNKEPGEQELVIIRSTDPEDARATIAEEDGESSMESAEPTHNSRYSEMPNSPNSTPLLDDYNNAHRSDTQNNDSNLADPPTVTRTRETAGLVDAGTHHDVQAETNPRGEAPPYFEVVDPADIPAAAPALQELTSAPSNDSNSPLNSPERRSGIRTFFNRMSVVGAPRGFAHAREDSSIFQRSSDLSHAISPSSSSTSPASPPTSRSHRATPSSTSSFFRTLSRQKSQSTLHSGHRPGSAAGLTSPSLISLNSISAPLTHTVLRTEFTYPKTGPTPEQLKMISSVESINRFAVPYGADAIAFASTSRLDVNSPPPDFDAVFGSNSNSIPLSGSRNGNSSSTSLHARGDSWQALAPSPLAQLASPFPIEAEASSAAVSGPIEALPKESNSEPILSTLSKATEISHTQASQSQEQSIAAKYNSLPFSSHTLTNTAQSSRSGPTGTTVSEFGLKVPASSSQSSHPPSAFNLGDNLSMAMRSESRASVNSHQTFETAAESLSSRRRQRIDLDSDEDDDHDSDFTDSSSRSRANTPVDNRREPTDATLTPSKRDTIIAPSSSTSAP